MDLTTGYTREVCLDSGIKQFLSSTPFACVMTRPSNNIRLCSMISWEVRMGYPSLKGNRHSRWPWHCWCAGPAANSSCCLVPWMTWMSLFVSFKQQWTYHTLEPRHHRLPHQQRRSWTPWPWESQDVVIDLRRSFDLCFKICARWVLVPILYTARQWAKDGVALPLNEGTHRDGQTNGERQIPKHACANARV